MSGDCHGAVGATDPPLSWPALCWLLSIPVALADPPVHSAPGVVTESRARELPSILWRTHLTRIHSALGMWLIMLLINDTVLAADSTLFLKPPIN